MNWQEANQSYLATALDRIGGLLRVAAGEKGSVSTMPRLETTMALDILCATLDLTPFERDVLVLCAGIELKGEFARLCATAQGDSNRNYPTFALALSALPDAHWSALAPGSPLRRWHLIEINERSLTQSPIRIDEHILHYLTGLADIDERLSAYLQVVRLNDDLVPSHQLIAQQVAAQLKRGERQQLIQVCGDDIAARRAIAAKAYSQLGVEAVVIHVAQLPSAPAELEILGRLIERECLLTGQGIIVEQEEARPNAPLNRLLECLSMVIFSARERQSFPNHTLVAFDIHSPTRDEVRLIWQSVLDDQPEVKAQLDPIIDQFNLPPTAIRAVSIEARTGGIDALWTACRSYARPQLEGLAQRIESMAEWRDLVLPESQLQILREISIHVRQRTTVYENWGFGVRSPRGLGISALFAGPSGTGKTLAAEVIANTLKLDLYRVDLSQIVSKYIGETEKNLSSIFIEAEGSGSILLFDEADALFGKRSEVKDSHDRYANIEVNYLLQRMETYHGLAILTTNLKSAIDTAFLRRIRFVIQFPFPDVAHRAEIWRRIFPPETPTFDLDFLKLARLNVTGGNIRNIALNAAFIAADNHEPVCMKHLLSAARSEYGKLEKMLTESEIGGWL